MQLPDGTDPADGCVEPSEYLPHNELTDALHKLLKQEIEGSNA